MKRTTKNDLLQTTAGLFIGILMYNLIFHPEEDIVQTVVRAIIVAVLAAVFTVGGLKFIDKSVK